MVLLVFLRTDWGGLGEEEDITDGHLCSKGLRHLRVALVRISLVIIILCVSMVGEKSRQLMSPQ